MYLSTHAYLSLKLKQVLVLSTLYAIIECIELHIINIILD